MRENISQVQRPKKNKTNLGKIFEQALYLGNPLATKSDSVHENNIIRKPQMLVVVTSVLLVAVVLLAFVGLSSDKSNEIQSEKFPIAALSFKNISNDEQQEYFSDGITSDLLADLSKIARIWLIALNTAFSYKNTDIDIHELGTELGVDCVIKGSVRKVKDDLRISARFFNVNNRFILWTDRSDGNLRDVFSLQDQVTAKIVAALELKLSEQERKRISQKYTNNVEA